MKKLFHDLFSRVEGMPFSITYPDRSTDKYGGAGEPTFNLIFRTEKAMRAILVNVELGFGEAYMVGDIDLEGKMTDLMTLVMTMDLIGAFKKVVYTVHLRALRSRQRVLRPVARQGHAVHLRLLQDAGGFHRPRSGAEARARVP
jgi:hypothetical protein